MSIRGYTELFLYGLLLVLLILHRFYGFYNLTILVLLFPLVFLPSEAFGLKSRWNLSLFALPLLYLIRPEDFFSLSLQAFAEELFFRALLLRSFSNFTVSLLFTLPHVLLYGDLWSFLTFFPSLFYGFVYKKTKALFFVSLLHLASNLLWFKVFQRFSISTG